MPRSVRNLLRNPAVVLPVAVLLVVGAWLGYRSSTKSSASTATTERIVTATSGTMSQTVSSSGTIEPESTEDLAFSSSGTVTVVDVKAGQKVKKGQVLAEIDSASLQSAVTDAEATVETNTAKVTSDESSGASSTQLAADEANLTSSQASLASARTALSGASLTSPIDGTVSTMDLTVGEQLGSSGGSGTQLSGTGSGGAAATPTAGSSASSAASGGSGSGSGSSSGSTSSAQIEVVSTDTYVVNLAIDSTEIDNIKTGATATVTPTGGTTSATGKVTSIGTVATTTSGVATFPVVVTVGGSPSGFYGGATASVAITYKQVKDAVQVPVAAVTNNGGQATVTVVSGSKRTTQVVTTGIQANGEIQISSGLQAGQQVAVAVPTFTRAPGANRTSTNGEGGTNGTGQFPGGFNGQPPSGFGGNQTGTDTGNGGAGN